MCVYLFLALPRKDTLLRGFNEQPIGRPRPVSERSLHLQVPGNGPVPRVRLHGLRSAGRNPRSMDDMVAKDIWLVLRSTKHIVGQILSNYFGANGWWDIFSDMAVGQNQWYHFGVGAPPILAYFSGDWDVHWGYRILTHGHLAVAQKDVSQTCHRCDR